MRKYSYFDIILYLYKKNFFVHNIKNRANLLVIKLVIKQ